MTIADYLLVVLVLAGAASVPVALTWALYVVIGSILNRSRYQGRR